MRGIKNKVVVCPIDWFNHTPCLHKLKVQALLTNFVSFQPQSLEWTIITDNFFQVKLEFFGKIIYNC